MFRKKVFPLLIALLPLLSTRALHAQEKLPLVKENFIGAYHITVGYDKTTHLIFPYKIVYVDLGTADLIAEKVEKVENVLKLKANVENFSTTNLTVLTGAGKYFSFVVNYEASPKELSIVLKDVEGEQKEPSKAAVPSKTAHATPAKSKHILLVNQPLSIDQPGSVIFEDVEMNFADMDKISEKIISSERTIRDLGSVGHGLSFAINGLYIKNNVIFFHLHAQNDSYINFDIESVRFYIKDKKVNKRTIKQEIELSKVHTFNEQSSTVKGKNCLDQVFAFEKITIPSDKHLVVEIYESKGGRHQSFIVESKDLVKASLVK